MNIAAYYTHLQNGGPMIPEYGEQSSSCQRERTLTLLIRPEELLKKFYAGGGSPAAGLMQYMEDLHSSEIASAQLAELQKIKAKQDEELAQAQAARLAAEQAKQQADAAAASPGQRLFNTPPHSPFHPGLSPRPSPRGSS